MAFTGLSTQIASQSRRGLMGKGGTWAGFYGTCNNGLRSHCPDYPELSPDNDIHSHGYQGWCALECANDQNHETGIYIRVSFHWGRLNRHLDTKQLKTFGRPT